LGRPMAKLNFQPPRIHRIHRIILDKDPVANSRLIELFPIKSNHYHDDKIAKKDF